MSLKHKIYNCIASFLWSLRYITKNKIWVWFEFEFEEGVSLRKILQIWLNNNKEPYICWICHYTGNKHLNHQCSNTSVSGDLTLTRHMIFIILRTKMVSANKECCTICFKVRRELSSIIFKKNFYICWSVLTILTTCIARSFMGS